MGNCKGDDDELAQRWPLLDTPTVRIIRALHRGRTFIWNHDVAVVERRGMTWGQFETLIALRVEEVPHRLSPTALYEVVQVSSGGLTKILSGLEREGYILRIDNPDDRRSRLVQLTDKGKSCIEQIGSEIAALNKEVIDGALTTEESGQLIRLLGKLVSAFAEREDGLGKRP